MVILPMITGVAQFPSTGGVSSGVQLEGGILGDIESIEFVGYEYSGPQVSFDWERPASDGHVESTYQDPTDGGTWKMFVVVEYWERGLLRSKVGYCEIPIDVGGEGGCTLVQ